VAGYVAGGTLGALAGQVGVLLQTDRAGLVDGLPELVFLAAVAALTAALVRSLVFDRDAHITVIPLRSPSGDSSRWTRRSPPPSSPSGWR